MIFVFPLPKVVLYPGTAQPLNIFEPRYIEMINDAVEGEVEIALAQTEPPGGDLARKGVLGHIRNVAGCGYAQLLEQRPDGTMMILLRASRKVRLDSAVDTDKPYIIAEATTIPENVELETGNQFYLHRILKETPRRIHRQHAHRPRTRKHQLLPPNRRPRLATKAPRNQRPQRPLEKRNGVARDERGQPLIWVRGWLAIDPITRRTSVG
ncbi:MAG: hypothetical protein EOP05_23895 [Proteobacteria bacterium]|nr:MAG: hypothetical protein EOP05_23895 [Pseudomonadota bacterium]